MSVLLDLPGYLQRENKPLLIKCGFAAVRVRRILHDFYKARRHRNLSLKPFGGILASTKTHEKAQVGQEFSAVTQKTIFGHCRSIEAPLLVGLLQCILCVQALCLLADSN